MAHEGVDRPRISADLLQPYASFLILECVIDNAHEAFEALFEEIMRRSLEGGRGQRELVARGLNLGAIPPSSIIWLGEEVYQTDSLIYRCRQSPSWASDEQPHYTDVEHRLAIALRRDRLIAVHCDPSLRDGIQRWLDRVDPPKLQRVAESVLNAAFIRGETKRLWLHGTHPRRATVPDNKIIGGTDVDATLLGFVDGSFAMSSARVAIPDDLGLEALLGAVGTSPGKSQIWNRPTNGTAEFLAVANEALMLVADVMAAGATVDRPFRLLTVEVRSLADVRNAYDLLVVDADSIRLIPDHDEDLLAAAEILDRALLFIDGDPKSSSFYLDVGLDGALGGRLHAQVERVRGRARFSFGYVGHASNPPVVREVFRALEDYGDELLSVYYQSGHTIARQKVWKYELRVSPFEKWEFQDFSGFNICQEKPLSPVPQIIHGTIGTDGDTSLFSWVAQFFSKGWLICDDGSGEIADFIHLAPDSTLSFIHVKSADSDSPKRGVAVALFEVVVAQAIKNIRYLTLADLKVGLARPTVRNPACWIDGRRVSDRSEFLQMLDGRLPQDESRVVIVQPHLCMPAYERLHSDESDPPQDLPNSLRLTLLETILNSARGTIVASGADIRVIGSLS